ncbi:MAG: hypothetical protein ACJA0V_002193 [Planctomycetota bacterium]|jgi:hypothetical protein
MTQNNDNANGNKMVEEQELRALFAPRRADAAQFSAGIAQRLAAAANAGDDDNPTDTDVGDSNASHVGKQPLGTQAFGKQAASVLPGVPVAGASGKSLLTTLTLPFLLLLGAIAAFVRGLRGVDPATYRDQPQPSARASKTNRAFQVVLPCIGSLLGTAAIVTFFVGGGAAATHLITLCLILAMLTMTWHIGQSARSGVSSSVHTGRVVIMLLLAAVFGCWAWLGSMIVFDGDSAFGHYGVGWVLCLGTAAAGLLIVVQSRHLDAGLGMILFLVLPLLGATALKLPSDTEARVRSHLANLSLDPETTSNWSQAVDLAQALAATGAAPLPLPLVRARLAKAIIEAKEFPPQPWSPELAEQVQIDADNVHTQVWSTAVRLNLLDREQLQQLARKSTTPTKLANLLADSGPLRLPNRDDFLLDCLLASRELNGQEREHLVQRIDRSWPDLNENTNALQQARGCVRWLERLGRRDIVWLRRDVLHKLLMRHWVSQSRAASFSRPGGFCTYANSNSVNSIAADISATADAVAIIESIGAPEQLSLHHVRAFLRHQVPASLLHRVIMGHSVLIKQAEASLLLLEDGIGLPKRGWLTILIGERMTLAALMLVLLALRAIRLSYTRERALVGAMP